MNERTPHICDKCQKPMPNEKLGAALLVFENNGRCELRFFVCYGCARTIEMFVKAGRRADATKK